MTIGHDYAAEVMSHRRNHPAWISDYYKSELWADLKSSYYSRHPRRCDACGKRGRDIHLHHRQYEGVIMADGVPVGVNLRRRDDWGKEPDEWFSVVCQFDHDQIHRVDDSGRFRTLAEATDYWINLRVRRKERARRWNNFAARLIQGPTKWHHRRTS